MVDSNKGNIQSNNGYFQINNTNGNNKAFFKAIMLDNRDIEMQFQAVRTKEVPLKSFEIHYPKTFYISEWNALSNNHFLGLLESGDGENYDNKLYITKFTPENASNTELKWEAKNPEIATYIPTFGKEIIPHKAGMAKFIVTSFDNPKLSQEVNIEFKYAKPLKSINEEDKILHLEQYEEKEFKLIANPVDATDQRLDWKVVSAKEIKEAYEDDEEAYPEEKSESSYDGISIESEISRYSLDKPHHITHIAKAYTPGIYEIEGTPKDNTGDAKPIHLKIVVSKDSEKNNDNDVVKEFLKKIDEIVTKENPTDDEIKSLKKEFEALSEIQNALLTIEDLDRVKNS